MNRPSKLWKQSVRKWEKIVKAAEKKKLPIKRLTAGGCGFCEKFEVCSNCQLFKEMICYYSHNERVTFWQIINELKEVYYGLEPDWKKVQKGCKKVLESVIRNRF